MRYTRVQTPRGTRDFLPSEAEKKRRIEESLGEVFYSWGYSEIVTPTYEFYEVLAAGSGPELESKMFKFFDREGHTLVLRPDLTTPVARVVATRLRNTPKPVRLFYSGNVFRYEDPQAGRQREFYQTGVELMGADGADSDAEVIALNVRAFEAVGLRNFRIDIGNVEYFNGILASLEIGADTSREIRNALMRRDYVRLREEIDGAGLPEPKRKLLLALPEMRGGMEVVDRALELADNGRSSKAAFNLLEVLDVLEIYGVRPFITVDFGMVKNIDYYTGMVLEGYVKDLGFPLSTGGRYDDLVSSFGYDCQATGFAMGIERLMSALEKQQAPKPAGSADSGEDDDPERMRLPIIVRYRTGDPKVRRKCLELVNALRTEGIRSALAPVVRDAGTQNPDWADSGTCRALVEMEDNGETFCLMEPGKELRREKLDTREILAIILKNRPN